MKDKVNINALTDPKLQVPFMQTSFQSLQGLKHSLLAIPECV